MAKKIETNSGKGGKIVALSIGLLVVVAFTFMAVKASAKPKTPTTPSPTPDEPNTPPSGNSNKTTAPAPTGSAYTGKGTPTNPFTTCEINQLTLCQLICCGTNPPPIPNGIGTYHNKPRVGG